MSRGQFLTPLAVSCGPIHGLVFKCFALVTLDTAAPKVAEDISIAASH